jgi:hypothetical protein
MATFLDITFPQFLRLFSVVQGRSMQAKPNEVKGRIYTKKTQ